MIRKKSIATCLVILFLIIAWLPGCSPLKKITNEENKTVWEQQALTQHFQKSLIETDNFIFTSFQKIKTLNEPIIIYIEGDGRAWITRTKLSTDPTPINPLALKLAFLDPSTNVAYLARPCQFTPLHLNKGCNPSVWSDLRFSESVIHSMNQAIDVIKMNAKAKQIHLVGFSGGGAVAVLIAARRKDVASLRTVAGDLDPRRLSQYHKTTPLTGSLNPSTVIPKITQLPQVHFTGEKDKVVPPFISEEFVREVNKLGSNCAKSIIVKNANHHNGWEEEWRNLLNIPVNCEHAKSF